MKLFCAATLVIALAGAPLFLQAAEPNTGPITFRASVLVNVDATGKPINVEAPQDLPEPIRNLIEKRVASWQYQPAKIGGVSQPATTYVSVNACAVPVAGGYTMGVDFDGNGPRHVGDEALAPPEYPLLAQREGTEAEFSLILAIGADGHAELSSIEKADFTGRGGRTGFEPILRRWVKSLRFDVELLAGKPVPAKMRMGVDFVMENRSTRTERITEFLANASASRECQMAVGSDSLKPVALDSVLTITPVPAG